MPNDQRSNLHYLWLLLILPLLTRQGLAQDASITTPDATATSPNTSNNASAGLISLTAPVKQRGAFIGEVDTRVKADGSGLLVNAAHITSLFKDKLTPEAIQRLQALPNNKFINAAEAKALGLDIHFDLAQAAVIAAIAGSARTLTELSLSGSQRQAIPNTGRPPQGVSAYLNMFANSSANDFDGSYKFNDPSFSFDGAVHIAALKHMTLEAFGSLNTDNDWERGDIRAVWRSQESENDWELRLGDVGTPGISYMEGNSIQGVEFTNFDTRNRNSSVVSSVGNREFFLERPAVAKLLIDGRETRRYRLDPGPYNVTDFPLANGANNVAFVIEDERGEVERIEFNVFSDTSLVAPGEYRYALSLGRGLSGRGAYSYDSDRALFSGFLETGITPALSLGGGLQISEEAWLGAATAKLGTPIGRFNFEAGLSDKRNGNSGEAAKVTWQNRRNYQSARRNQPSLAFSAAYQSPYFGGLFDDETFNQEAWRFDASYSQNLFNNVSFGIGSSYTQNRNEPDSYRHTLSLGKSFNHWQLGASLSYEEDGDDEGWAGLVTVSYDFNKRSNNSTRISARHEQEVDGSQLTTLDISSNYSQGIKFGNGLLDYRVGLSADEDGDGSITGNLDYTANRFEFSASHSIGIDSLTGGDNDGQRTTLRAGMAVAFAEGQFAVGRPIRDSFAIFYPHETIADKTLLIGNRNKQGVYPARSDGFGPLLLGINSGSIRAANTTRFDVEDLPLGYDLGTGLTNLSPHYKSGFAVEVGSAYNVIATATLFDSFDRPLKLLLGKATELDVPNGRSVDAFTDSEGRLSASGLAGGRWKLEMFAKEPINYVFTVPRGKTGIVELGALKPFAGDL